MKSQKSLMVFSGMMLHPPTMDYQLQRQAKQKVLDTLSNAIKSWDVNAEANVSYL